MAFSLQPISSTTSLTSCLCHKAGVQGPLTDFSSVSWKTFKKMIFSKYMEGKRESGPYGGYHRKCYQNYTAKSHIEWIAAKRRKIETGASSLNTEQETDIPQTRSSLHSTNIKSCWIRQTEKTDAKEKLTNCQTLQAGSTLLESAKVRDDRRLIVALDSQDPVAIEECYHKLCYRYYTNLKQTEVKDT